MCQAKLTPKQSIRDKTKLVQNRCGLSLSARSLILLRFVATPQQRLISSSGAESPHVDDTTGVTGSCSSTLYWKKSYTANTIAKNNKKSPQTSQKAPAGFEPGAAWFSESSPYLGGCAAPISRPAVPDRNASPQVPQGCPRHPSQRKCNPWGFKKHPRAFRVIKTLCFLLVLGNVLCLKLPKPYGFQGLATLAVQGFQIFVFSEVLAAWPRCTCDSRLTVLSTLAAQ